MLDQWKLEDVLSLWLQNRSEFWWRNFLHSWSETEIAALKSGLEVELKRREVKSSTKPKPTLILIT